MSSKYVVSKSSHYTVHAILITLPLVRKQHSKQSTFCQHLHHIICYNGDDNFISGAFGPEYNQLGIYSSISEVESDFKFKAVSDADEMGSVVRVVEVQWRRDEAKSAQGCPIYNEVLPLTSDFS